MRIALIGPAHPYKGGGAWHTTELARWLADAGHDVVLESWRHQYPAGLYPGGRQTVKPGHLDVHERDIGKCAPAHLDCPLTIADHGYNIVAQRFQLVLQTHRDCLFVIRDQNSIGTRHRRYPWLRVRTR